MRYFLCLSEIQYTALSVFCRRLLLMLPFLLIPAVAGAQALSSSDSSAPKPAEPAAPADPFGRSTPAGTIDGFIKAIAAQDYKRASAYLDLSHVSPGRRAAAGPELAQDLQRALDRGGRILPRLSEDPAGHLDDDLDPALERVGSIGVGAQTSALLLRRVGSGDDEHWIISHETVEAASTISAGGGATDVLAEAWLPAAFSATMIAGVPASHWLTLLGIMIVVFAVIWASLHYFLFVLGRIGWKQRQIHRFLRATHLPLALLLTLAIVRLLVSSLGVSIIARQAYGWLLGVVGPFLLGWLLLRVIDAVSDRVLERFGHRSRATATSIVRFAGRLAKAAIIAIVGMTILDAFGFDVTGVVAALGIGGLALALGAQKTVENLVASVSILSDRPLRVGDFCKIGDAQGTVEDIGMRSTRIRTSGRSIVTIPNSNLVNSQIENFASRDRFLFNPTLHLPIDTPPEKLRPLLVALREALDGDDRLLGRTARLRLLLPTSDRLPIEIFGYILTADFDAFLQVQEEVILKLLDVIAANGLVLAPPALDLRRNER